MIPLFYLRAEDSEQNDFGMLIHADIPFEAEKLWREHFQDAVKDLVPKFIGAIRLTGLPGFIEWDDIIYGKPSLPPAGGVPLFFVRGENDEGFNFDALIEARDRDEAVKLWRASYKCGVEGLDPMWVGQVPLSDTPGVINWDKIHVEDREPEQPDAGDAPR